MAVTLTGTGGIFKRLGRLAGGIQDIIALMGGSATARTLSTASFATRGTNIEADAAESPAISSSIDGHWQMIDTLRSSVSGTPSQFRSLAEKILIQQVDLDANLPTKDVTTALKELIRQMKSSSDSLNASTVSIGSQTSVGSPVGNPVIVATSKNAKGEILQNIFAETLRFEVTGDYLGTATARQEPVSIRGKAAITDVFAYNYPAGSGCSTSVNLIDSQQDNSGNLLTNSDFETFTTSNTPDNWTIQTGLAGTDIFSGGSGAAYLGSNCLQLTGDGSTLIKLYQEFDHAVSTTAGAGGTTGVVEPLSQYAVFGKIKVSAAPSTGVLRVALVDSSGTVINDENGTANSFTVDLTALNTSYATFSGVFQLPANTPSTVRLQLQTTTAVESGKSVYIDSMAMAETTQLYNGGPSLAIFAGATKVVTGDSWTVAITNSKGVLADWMERLFSLRDKGLAFPYSGSPTVADSLVT